jgi:hypothetical protein
MSEDSHAEARRPTQSAKMVRFGVPNSIDPAIWTRLNPDTNRLTRLKVEKARKKYRGEVEDETKQIHFDNRGNANSMAIPYALLRMQLKKADEFAEQQYSIFRDVWIRLGGVESAAFIRTISWMVIQRPFDARASVVMHDGKRLLRATGGLRRGLPEKEIREAFAARKGEWREKLEIKALEWEAEALAKGWTVAMRNSSGETTSRTHEQPHNIRHGFGRKVLPGATIYGVRPDSNEYVAWDGVQYVLRPTRDAVLADTSLMPIGSVEYLRVSHPHPGRIGAIEVVIPAPQKQKDKPQSTSGRRRKSRCPDARKELIAILKARHPRLSTRKICELIDRQIDSTPAQKFALAPLESWVKLVPTARSWVGLIDHPRTRNRVGTYVNKVPPLKTASKSSK